MFRLSLSFFLLFILFGIQACTMSDTQKFLELNIQSEGIGYYIKFNDEKVFSDRSKGSITQVIPLNHWAVSGENNVFISVNYKTTDVADRLSLAKNNRLEVSLNLREKKGGIETSYTLSKFNLLPSEDTPEVIASRSLGNVKLNSDDDYTSSEYGDILVSSWLAKDKKNWQGFSQSINIDTRHPKWAYQSADDLGDDQTMTDDQYYGLIDDLYNEYKRIWGLHKSKELNALKSELKLRASEYDSAFYLEPGSKLADLERSLISAFDHESLSLSDMISKDRAFLNIVADGKVARLTVANVGEALIYYSHKDGHFTRFYDLYFMRKDGKWIVIR